MFTMDVPATLPQQTPIVLAQAAAPGTGSNTPQPDYLLTTCKQTESTGNPKSAGRAVDPAGMLAVYLQNYDNRVVDMAMLNAIKTTLLQETTHANLLTSVSKSGRTTYHYDPIPNYTGNDKAIFMAEFEGKRYKIVVNIVVSPTVGESPLMEGEEPVCPPPELIKVTSAKGT